MAPRIFFCFNIFIFIYFFKYETIETHARAFLTVNILAIGRVCKVSQTKAKKTFLSLPFCSNFWQRPTFFQSDEHSRPSSEHYSLLSSSEEDEELVPLRKHSVSFIKKIGPVMKTFAKSPQQTTKVP